MALRILWDDKEVAILVDYCTRIIDGKISRAQAVEAASKELRNRAVHKGIAIDELFRNKNGISMQLSKIEDLFMNREGGLSKAPQLFINTVNLYFTDKKAYDEILREARLMDENNVMTQENLNAIELMPNSP